MQQLMAEKKNLDFGFFLFWNMHIFDNILFRIINHQIDDKYNRIKILKV